MVIKLITSRLGSKSLRDFAGLVLALFVLNFALSFHNVWPTLWITTRHELSIEIAVILLALAVYSRYAGKISSFLLSLLALVLTVMTIGRYAEVTAPALFGRAVNLYWDGQHFLGVAAMLIQVARPLLLAALIVGVIVLLGSIFMTLRFALSHIARLCAEGGKHRAIAALGGVVIMAYMAGYMGMLVNSPLAFSRPVTRTYWQQVEFMATAFADNGATDVIPASSPLEQFDMPRLGGADVFVQFVESYGATAFDTPSIAGSIAPDLEAFAVTLAASQRRVVSAFVESPTFGGGSWLAHSSFMTGLDIRDNAIYNLLLTQDRTTLSSRFAELGYRSVALMPGMRNEWPEGSFYGFDEIYGSRVLDYQGPEFGWWRIPDQYSLARLAELELQQSTQQPLFLLFNTISTHMPFRPTPPYQADWQRLLSTDPFEPAALQKSLALLPEWSNMRPAYAATLAYTFTYMSEFLREHPDRDILWIILGDHQPPAIVSGEGARWDVPVHVVSANNEIIDALLQRGFVEGLTPADQSLGAMYQLPVTLMDVLDH